MGLSRCSHLHDTASSHYLVQQTLYAFILAAKYDLLAQRALLVQCHPATNGLDFNEVTLDLDFKLAQVLSHVRERGNEELHSIERR